MFGQAKPESPPASGATTVAGRGLEKGFGAGSLRSVALKGVTTDFAAGQLSVLMGPSGSGKSTLLAILSGLLHPDAGSVLVLGEDLWRMSDPRREAFRRRHFGFIFQGFNLFPALTARQQLEIVLQWGQGATAGQAARAAAETLTLLGLGEKQHLRPHQLSGGEKQRVAIARALVKRPAILFADEPTSALDWEHGRQVVELLRGAAHDRAATAIVVTHDPRLVPLADRLVYLEDGRLAERPAGVEAVPQGPAEGL